MKRRFVMVITLMLLVSNPLYGDVKTTEGVLLSTVILSENLPFTQEPASPQSKIINRQLFGSLVDAILHYESIQNSDRWQPIASGPLLRLGDRHPQVSALKRQLLLLGDLPAQSVFKLGSRYFDDELHEALLRFQMRHRSKADGIVGPQTRALLNVPPWQRIDQLVLNMHRQQRAEINDEVYLHINLPEYRLRLFQYGEELLEMRTVIGKSKRQTPEFSATVERLIINPDWNVPKSIAYKDILPKLKQDPGFLEKRNLRVLSGWGLPRVEVSQDELDYERFYRGADYYRFWEPPGKGNTLAR